MDDLHNGERQVAPDISGIRRDHVARYEFAAELITQKEKPPIHTSSGGPTSVPWRAFDFACGVGYGSRILHDHGLEVYAADRSNAAIQYAVQHYGGGIPFHVASDAQLAPLLSGNRLDWCVCFETIEHIEDPLPMLRTMCRGAPNLIASVPNETVFPHGGRIKHHFRHYTAEQFKDLLEAAGYVVTAWYGQEGPESEVEPNIEGRTLIAVARRAESGDVSVPFIADQAAPALVQAEAASPFPAEGALGVTILGLGASVVEYLEVAKRMGGRRALGDEVWGINALGDVFLCDRVFHMDDMRIQEIRSASAPKSNIAAMVEWLKTHPGPVYTSRAYDQYPGLVEYPLENVMNTLGVAYFNSTAAYAVALVVYEKLAGIKDWGHIALHGLDFSYPNSHHAEKGRACVEFWLGRAMATGIKITMPESTTLMDMCVPEDERLYGYGRFGTRDVQIVAAESGKVKLALVDRATLPTAEEIADAYNHAKPTVPAQMLGAGPP